MATFESGLTRSLQEQAPAIARNFQSRKRNIQWEAENEQRYENVPETLLRLTNTGQKFIEHIAEKRQKAKLAAALRDQWRDPDDRIRIATEHISKMSTDMYDKYYEGNKAATEAINNLALSPDRAALFKMEEGPRKDLALQKYLKDSSTIEYPAWLSTQFTTNNTWLRVDGMAAPFQINDPNLNRAQRAAASEYLTDIYLDKKGVYNLKPGYTNHHGYWDAIKKAEASQMAAGMKLYNTKKQFESEDTARTHFLSVLEKGNMADTAKAFSNYIQVFAAGTTTPGGKNKRSFGDIQQTLWDLADDLNKSEPNGRGAKLAEYLNTGYYLDTDGNKRKFAKRKALANIEANVKESTEQENQNHDANVVAEKRMGKDYQTEINEILVNPELTKQERADAIDKKGVEYTQKWRSDTGNTGIPWFVGNEKQKNKNTYNQDKYELTAIQNKQGGILFEDQIEGRDAKLVNELRQQGDVIKGSVRKYIESIPAYKTAVEAIDDDLSGVWSRTGYGAFPDGDGELFKGEILKDLRRLTLLEGKSLGRDPDKAVENALVGIRERLKSIKGIEEAKATDWYKRFTTKDDTGSNVRNELSLLFEGKLKNADFNKLPDLTNDLVSLRLLPENRQLEITRVGSGQIPIGTPLTNDIYDMYLNSITRGELEVYGILSKPELMAKLSEAAGLGKVDLPKAALEERKTLDACSNDPKLKEYIAPYLSKVRKYPNDRAHGIALYNACQRAKLGGLL